jgi:hypothetical protein
MTADEVINEFLLEEGNHNAEVDSIASGAAQPAIANGAAYATNVAPTPTAPPKPLSGFGKKGWGSISKAIEEAKAPEEEKDADDVMADFLDDEDEVGGKKKVKSAFADPSQEGSGGLKGKLGNRNAAPQQSAASQFDIMVQGTLIGYLDKVTRPRTKKFAKAATILQGCGGLLILTGILVEGVDVIDKLFGDGKGANTIQMFIAIGVECVINKLMMMICLNDLLIAGMCKMRLFNGYMADDPTLTMFMRLQKVQEKLSTQFKAGKAQAEDEVMDEFFEEEEARKAKLMGKQAPKKTFSRKLSKKLNKMSSRNSGLGDFGK